MKVSISGTNGFLGKNIYNYLKTKNFEVLGVQRKSNNKKFFFLKWKLGENLPNEVLESDIFIHCAFDNSKLEQQGNLKNNVNYTGFKKMLSNLRNKKCKLFFISSQTANKKTVSNYGKLKYLSEKLVKKNKKAIIIKPGLIYCKKNSAVINSMKKILKFKIFFYFSKKKKIYPIHIKDFCECIYRIIKLKKKKNIYYLGSLYPISIIDFIKFACRDNNLKYPLFILMPKNLLLLFAKILDFFKFSKLSISERIKSIDTMPLMNTYNSLKKIKMTPLNKFE
jgi:nucleoside-diphosphate-sugar epimerase